jgi:hypothetical protein
MTQGETRIEGLTDLDKCGKFSSIQRITMIESLEFCETITNSTHYLTERWVFIEAIDNFNARRNLNVTQTVPVVHQGHKYDLTFVITMTNQSTSL